LICVWIVSPIPALRAGLRALLTGDPEITVAGVISALAAGTAFPAEAGVMILTPGGLDAAALQRLAEQPGWTALLVGDDPAAAARLARGLPPGRAWGLLASEAAPEALSAALRALDAGLAAASPELVSGLLARLPEEDPANSGELPPEPLTERETDVLRLAAQGLTNKQIALALGISEHTVKFHISAIFDKLGVSNRAEAVRKGARWGWVPL